VQESNISWNGGGPHLNKSAVLVIFGVENSNQQLSHHLQGGPMETAPLHCCDNVTSNQD